MKDASISRCRDFQGRIFFIAILLLVGMLAFFVGGYMRERYFHGITGGTPRSVATEAKIQQLRAAVQSYQTNAGVLPTPEQGLRALLEKPLNEPIPIRWVKLASESDLLDSWKTPFAYHVPARGGKGEFEIVSAGADKPMNTQDDISGIREYE